MSLTLRLGVAVVGVLLVAVLGVGYLFERSLSSALSDNRRADLRLHAERTADELRRHYDQLRGDLLFLAGSPPLRAIAGDSPNKPVSVTVGAGPGPALYEHAAQAFLAVTYARPMYTAIRLFSGDQGQPEVVRVVRTGDQVHETVGPAVAGPGEGDVPAAVAGPGEGDVPAAVTLRRGDVHLWLHPRPAGRPEVAAAEAIGLRAVTAVVGNDGDPVALIAIDVDPTPVIDDLEKLFPAGARMALLDGQGRVLHLTQSAEAGDGATAAPGREQDFPGLAGIVAGVRNAGSAHAEVGSGEDARALYATRRYLPIAGQQVPVTVVLSQASNGALAQTHRIRADIYFAIGVLLALAAALGALIVHDLMRPLRELVGVSEALTQGNYDIAVVEAGGRDDVSRLTAAFHHMVRALRERERRLRDTNQDLERQVAMRTGQLQDSRAALLRERELQQSILDNVGDGVVAIDSAGRFMLWNERAQALFGTPRTEVPAAEWSRHFGVYQSEAGDLFPTDQLPLVRALRGETVRAQEVFIRNEVNPQGSWVAVSARPLSPPGQPVTGAVAVLVDIGEKRALQTLHDTRARELARIGRLSLIGQIVDTAVHRLSQPLAAIANYVGAALQLHAAGRLDTQRLEEILGHLQRLADRGGEGLAALRMLLPRREGPPQETDVNKLVMTALGLIEDRTRKAQIEVETRLEESLPAIVIERDQLYQALVHLLLNAVDALTAQQDRERRLVLVTRRCDNGTRVCISVGDTGPGIAAEVGDGIFEPWYSTKPDALGIGLSVVRGIAESHNSDVALEHRDGMTWFSLRLPAGNTS